MNPSFLFTFFFSFFLLSQVSAHASADPGTGDLLWQLILATTLGSFYYVYQAYQWVKSKFSFITLKEKTE